MVFLALQSHTSQKPCLSRALDPSSLSPGAPHLLVATALAVLGLQDAPSEVQVLVLCRLLPVQPCLSRFFPEMLQSRAHWLEILIDSSAPGMGIVEHWVKPWPEMLAPQVGPWFKSRLPHF